MSAYFPICVPTLVGDGKYILFIIVLRPPTSTLVPIYLRGEGGAGAVVIAPRLVNDADAARHNFRRGVAERAVVS